MHKPNLKIILLLALLASVLYVRAQEDSLIFSATILDKNTNTVIPYATVFNTSQQMGTTSNSDGYFELTGIKKNDVIMISLVGYKAKKAIITRV